MANDRLPLSQIQPSAKPVSSFIRTQAINPAAPAKPSMLPSASGVQIVQRGNVSNVKGYNSLRQLSDAVKLLVESYLGKKSSRIKFDYSDIRPKGARLVTSGGKAPGPQPLKECLIKNNFALLA